MYRQNMGHQATSPSLYTHDERDLPFVLIEHNIIHKFTCNGGVHCGKIGVYHTDLLQLRRPLSLPRCEIFGTTDTAKEMGVVGTNTKPSYFVSSASQNLSSLPHSVDWSADVIPSPSRIGSFWRFESVQLESVKAERVSCIRFPYNDDSMDEAMGWSISYLIHNKRENILSCGSMHSVEILLFVTFTAPVILLARRPRSYRWGLSSHYILTCPARFSTPTSAP